MQLYCNLKKFKYIIFKKPILKFVPLNDLLAALLGQDPSEKPLRSGCPHKIFGWMSFW